MAKKVAVLFTVIEQNTVLYISSIAPICNAINVLCLTNQMYLLSILCISLQYYILLMRNFYLSTASVLLFTVLLTTLGLPVSAFSQTTDKSNPSPLKFPSPKGIVNQLFYLQRDPNTNTIICELNTGKNGEVDKKEPVLVYWLRYANKGEKQDLNYIQRKFAYGIQSKEIGKDQYELTFVSHKKLPLYLLKDAGDKKFHVYVTVNKKKVKVDRIFVRIEGGSFWLPNVKYVEVKGAYADSNVPALERIKI